MEVVTYFCGDRIGILVIIDDNMIGPVLTESRIFLVIFPVDETAVIGFFICFLIPVSNCNDLVRFVPVF